MMAVQFTNTGFTIHFNTRTDPASDWILLHQQLIDVLRIMDASAGISNNEYYLVLQLLQEMMPDEDTLKKIVTFDKP